jgi:glycosyltransferase involved in cell wall biosynthesis
MYQGCPVVCSDAGGNPELVQDGYNGFLFSSGDASSLALRLSDMIADDEASIRMGNAASQCVRDRHSLKRVAERSVEIYERVIANYRSVINS